MAAGELLVGDPDLLDNAVANLEHRRRASIGARYQ